MKNLAACIIESRQVDLIGAVQNHLKYLPEDTDLFVSHSPYDEEIKKLYPNVTFLVGNVQDLHSYNTLLTSASFWVQFFKYKRILVFQTDSKLLRKGIEEFYEWDYIGAPWKWNGVHPGNGGFSLRNPKTMFDVCMKYPHDTFMNEDIYFSNLMFAHPELGRLAPREVAMTFSVEGVFCLGSLGIHAPEKWLPAQEVHQLLHQYDNINEEV